MGASMREYPWDQLPVLLEVPPWDLLHPKHHPWSRGWMPTRARSCPHAAGKAGALGGRGTHSVLEARLVSSCLSFPSSASPRFSRLLARKGVSV